MREKKHRIREKKHRERLKLGENERDEFTGKIEKRLFSLPEFKKAGVVAFYVGIEGEINTLNMIQKALELGKKVLVPVTDFSKREMRLSELKDIRDLDAKELSSGNILLEPKKEKQIFVEEKEASLIIVPLVAFDKKCHRLGYGAGFYDRFLKKLESHITTIGLAFECQKAQGIPAEEHDIRLKKILTEKRIITCL